MAGPALDREEIGEPNLGRRATAREESAEALDNRMPPAIRNRRMKSKKKAKRAMPRPVTHSDRMQAFGAKY
jgi:hypothetical protein